MGKEINATDIPAEVLEVWAIQIARQPVGIVTWERCNEIIKRNLEYFEWDHKYAKIPQSVHDAYKEEAFPPFDYSKLQNKEEFIGLIPRISMLPDPEPQKQLTIKEMLVNLFKGEQEARERKEAAHLKSKALWDKYYSVYGLEYRP